MRKLASTCAALLLALVGLTFSPVPQTRADGGEYYYNAGRRIPIVRSATRVAMRTATQASKAGAVARLSSLESVRSVRDIGAGGLVEVTLAARSAKAPDTAIAEVAAETGGELLPVFFEPGQERDQSTLFVSDDLLVRFRADVTRIEADALAARVGAELVEPLRYVPNGFRLRVLESSFDANAVTAANALYETGRCVWAHPNFLAHRATRFAPNDPQYANQWHLNNTGQGGGTPGADVEAEQAWEITQGSPDVSVAVADTGIDVTHEDFAVTIDGLPKVHDPRDVVHGDDDPTPSPNDADGRHGTSASGVAVAASNNGLDTAGIAPRCRLIPIQLYAESTFTPNSTEADAFTWAADHGAWVMSNSWGPDNDDTPLPDATREAMDYATTTGRGGLGTVIFFAAGNSGDDTVHDNYVSYARVVAVAATTNFDTRSSYSRFGQAISIAAPSSGGTLGITTTDVTGGAGYSTGNFTSAFGGTSSACPLAAGVAALVLSVNPSLTWQEVKSVLEQTADKIDTAGGAYDTNGRSVFYGFGRVNARAAVELARDLADSSAPRVTLVQTGQPIGAGGTFDISWTVSGANAITSQTLEYSSNGQPYLPIATVAPGTTTYTWSVPGELAGSVTVRISVADDHAASATSTVSSTVWARPSISRVRLKKTPNGSFKLVVDGTAIRVGEGVVYVGDVALGSTKFPSGQANGDGTTRRIISKDRSLKSLIPNGATVVVTVRHPSTGQVSEQFLFTR